MSKKGIELLKNRIDDNGNVTFSDLPDMMQLDYIKKALGELSENARGEFDKRTPDSDMFGNMAFQLRKLSIGQILIMVQR